MYRSCTTPFLHDDPPISRRRNRAAVLPPAARGLPRPPGRQRVRGPAPRRRGLGARDRIPPPAHARRSRAGREPAMTLTITHAAAEGTLIDGTSRGDGTSDEPKANGWRDRKSVV